MDELDYWDELTVKYTFDSFENNYFIGLMQLINQQLDNGVEWLESQEARDFFHGETKYQQDVFEALESEWEGILTEKYKNIDELIGEVYDYGKIHGYQDMSVRIRYTKADKLALTNARNYNYKLIQKLDDELRRSIKNRIFQGLISGENPRAIAPKLAELGLKPLPNSTLSARQRAVMIARTEVARAQNTGILQSYVNEGYEEVKILTSEDENVCYLCLKNAYEFNDDTDVIYSNHGPERVHNIPDLIRKKQYVPLHPNCRCTYLSVWKRDRTPPDNPYTVDLTNEESRNWSYNYNGKYEDLHGDYQFKGNTSLSRQEFLEEYCVDLNELNKPHNREDKLFLQIFTKDASPLNTFLRNGSKPDEFDYYSKKWEEVNLRLMDDGILSDDEILSFDRALIIAQTIFDKYSKPIKENIILCRREKDRFMGKDGAKSYDDKGFTSTSIHEFTKIDKYGREVNYILIPSGTPILYVEGITSSSEDYEVFFPPEVHLEHAENINSKKKVWIYP